MSELHQPNIAEVIEMIVFSASEVSSSIYIAEYCAVLPVMTADVESILFLLHPIYSDCIARTRSYRTWRR